MNLILQKLNTLKDELKVYNAKLIAVSKTYPTASIESALEAGQVDFGENKVQEMVQKYEALPKNIRWHMIGHLQSNKVKYIASFVHLIHAVDSEKLLKEINKEALKNDRVIDCLLQVHIAQEETKFGFSAQEIQDLIASATFKSLQHIRIVGLMGMATNTTNQDQISSEFKVLKSIFVFLKNEYLLSNIEMKELSMGMSNDYLLACQEGSTMVRIGSAIFGSRN
ncbi:MAG: YggS family pyridoxal phosphate-dependent enzyme [Cytophagales bacterium]|nr:MAG: YggS family pyridoxal phosphate-dependent enzyme [Cytophagales bacterium]